MAASGSYASALGNLRDTVKWIIAAFTGAGAIIFSGLAVTNISTLAESGQWVLPLALAAVPLVATVVVILAALRVINVTSPAISGLFPAYWESLTGRTAPPTPRPTALDDELPNAVAVYGTAADFDDRLVKARDQVRRTQGLLNGSADRQKEYEDALALLDGLQITVKEALDCAAYVQARQRYKAAMWQIFGASIIAVAGLVASGVVSGSQIHAQQASNVITAKEAPPVPVPFQSPTQVLVWFTAKPPVAARGPGDCPLWNGMPALAVGGTASRPLLLFSGYSAANARGHGAPEVPRQCGVPWLWATSAGQVLVVPR